MKLPIKLLLAVLGLGVVAALAFFAWSAKAKTDGTFHLANGVEVTPVEVNSDDLAKLLDAKIWKFNVVFPRDANAFAVIALCQNGKPPKVIAGGLGTSSMTEPSRLQYTVGFMPIGGTFNDAKELKYSVSTGNAAGTGTIPNPFIHSHGNTQDAEVDASQNLVFLMSGNIKKPWIASTASLNETALALEFEVYLHHN